jgi:pimeloyl-ACP methyl ester carboxylesterase
VSRAPARPPRWQEKAGLALFRALAPRLPEKKAPAPPAALAPFEELLLPGENGCRGLSATWFPANRRARGAVLLLHPWLVWGRSYFHRRGRIHALREAGYHALTIDFPGFGDSDGPVGLYDRYVERALEVLKRRASGLDLFVWGVSSGGYWAHPALSRTSQVAGAMFEDVSPHLLEWSWRTAPLGRPCYLFFEKAIPATYRYLDARRHAGAFDLGAVTYVSGARDQGVLPKDTRQLAEAAGGRYRIFQEAGHLGSIKVARKAVISTALETFERASRVSETSTYRPADLGEVGGRALLSAPA